MQDHTTHDSTQEIPYGYCHCGCGQKTKLRQFDDPRNGYSKGDPMRFVRNHDKRIRPKPIYDARQFWSRVDKRGPDDCWEWQGPKSRGGYGFDRDARHFDEHLMHRVAYIYANGQIPNGLHICHHCDNRICCNPNHLFAGTNQDNIADKVAKSRQPRGKAHGIAKLTEEQVIEIRKRYAQGGIYMRELGEQYGVKYATISAIIRRENWDWLE